MLPKTLIVVPLLAVGCGITAASAPVIDAQCADQPRPGADPRWQAPGSFLVLEDRDHLLVIWEGVFFELTRDARAATAAAVSVTL